MIHEFRTASVEISGDVIRATFRDGRVNEMNVAWLGDDQYRGFARQFGYEDNWRLYALEHELTHHWLADRMGWNFSFSLHDNPPMPWPLHVGWEEHLVNAIQRLGTSGESDPFGVPQAIWGDHLGEVLRHWSSVVRGISVRHREFYT